MTECQFVGSFYALDQLPRDPRPQVAIAGRSNVGKSSLLNRLVGRKKIAKVSSTPGKTRALNFFLIDQRYYFVDLPGYGYAKVPIDVRKEWGKLMEAYLEKSRELAGLILLIDVRRDPTPEDVQMLEWLAARKLPAMIALTKVDKVKRGERAAKLRQLQDNLGVGIVPCSSVTGEGKSELLAAINELVTRKPGKQK